jgi:hypothetical protein
VLNFDVESRAEGDRAIVAVRGDIDLQVAERVVAVRSAEPSQVIDKIAALLRRASQGWTWPDNCYFEDPEGVDGRIRAGACAFGDQTDGWL